MTKRILLSLSFSLLAFAGFAQSSIGARLNYGSWFITDLPEEIVPSVSVAQNGFGVNLFYQYTLEDSPNWRLGADLGLTFIPKSNDELFGFTDVKNEKGGFAFPIAGTVDYIWNPSSSFNFYTGVQFGLGMMNRTQDYSDDDTSFSKSSFRSGFNYGFRLGGEFELTDKLRGQVNLGWQLTINKSTVDFGGMTATWPTSFGSYYIQAGVAYPLDGKSSGGKSKKSKRGKSRKSKKRKR